MKKFFLTLTGILLSIGLYAQTDFTIYQDCSQYSMLVDLRPEGGRGCLSGAFSVSATEQIQFAPGNLQYRAGTDTWRFAEYQYDIVGGGNNNISATYSGWIDLFGWGTGNDPAKSDTNNKQYATFTDWGINPIQNGNTTDAPNTWRTLTKAEWDYIFYTRAHADTLYQWADVDEMPGMILLPDNWDTTTVLQTTYTAYEWLQMEDSGAVFLPAAGDRYGTSAFGAEATGDYWSSTADDSDSDSAFPFGFYSSGLFSQYSVNRCFGRSVRLVRPL